MRKPIIWATSLAVAVLGAVLFSCDSKGSSPTGSGNDTTTTPGTGTSYVLSILSPTGSDTTIPFETTRINISGKLFPVKAGLSVKVGDSTVLTKSDGTFSRNIPNLVVGKTSFRVILASDTSNNSTVSVTRRLGAPIVAAVGAPSQTEFPDSVQIQLVSVNGVGDSIHYTTSATQRITSADPIVASGTKKTLTGTTTIKAIAVKNTPDGLLTSDTTLVTFTIDKRVAIPYFSTSRMDSANVVEKIAINASGANDTVRYTNDGGDPTVTSRIYTDSILVSDSTTIIARSFRGVNFPSPACTTTVKLIALAPIFSPAPPKGGAPLTSQKNLALTSPSGLPVYYTTDGTTPTLQSAKYSDTLLLDSNITIKAIAAKPNWRSSPVVTASYKFKVANPVLSFTSGNYDTTQNLKISDSATGATIHYTFDGSIPTCKSTLYNPDSLLRVDSSVVVNARACLTGWDSSNVATGNYAFKVSKITFSPDSGVYRSYQTVTISTRSPGVSLFVTRDSSQPAWDALGAPTGSTVKLRSGDTLQLTQSQWLRVVAQRSDWTSSVPDSRRYIIQGDTLLIDDFEQNSLSNPIGTHWNFWACGYCTNTGIPNQMSGVADTKAADWNTQIGFRYGKIDFTIPDNGSQFSSDTYNGPGYAGYSVGVPDSLMGETYRLVFWAKWVKGSPSLPDSMPMASEMVWNNNDKQNGAYQDGFNRYVDWVGPAWKRYIVDLAAFRPASNAYEKTLWTDSTTTAPKSFGLVWYPDSARMVSMGLSKFQGWVDHSDDWVPHWVWGANHDTWVKNNIHAFKWSILQPSTDNSSDPNDQSSIASLTRGLTVVVGQKDTAVDSTYSDSTGLHHTTATHKAPVWGYCGDCHFPEEPVYSTAIRSKFLKGISGSLQLDRIQLVRRPQPGK